MKLGEGTYGEAFKGGGNVFKIVPMDGDFQVNGEIQKVNSTARSELCFNAMHLLCVIHLSHKKLIDDDYDDDGVFLCLLQTLLQTSAEILSEVLLHNTLNKLRGDPTSFNMCTNFIHTKA